MQMSYELCFVYSAAMNVTTGMNCVNVGSETTSTAWMCVKYELADGIFGMFSGQANERSNGLWLQEVLERVLMATHGRLPRAVRRMMVCLCI